jgi:hypothetical protein
MPHHEPGWLGGSFLPVKSFLERNSEDGKESPS